MKVWEVIEDYEDPVDEKAWTAVEVGWTAPKGNDNNDKPRSKWTNGDHNASNANQKALNSIQTAITMEVFTLICETAKEAWDVLQNTYEGNSKVKKQRLEQLTTRFEELKIEDNETINMFLAKLVAFLNESFSLGERLSKEKLVRKVMRSLPEQFDYKITAIDEARDVSDMKLEELMGSLITFEMNFRTEKSDKKKSTALAVESSNKNSEATTMNQDELVESFALFTKNFGKAFNRFKKKGGNAKNFNNSKNSTGSSNQNKKKSSSRTGIQCHECHGFGHIQSECVNTLKKLQKKNKSFNVSQSDEESNDSGSDFDEESIALWAISEVQHQIDYTANPLALETNYDMDVYAEVVTVAFIVREEKTQKNTSENVTMDTDTDSDSDEANDVFLAKSYEIMHQKCVDAIEVNRPLSAKLSEVTEERD
ncbi:uncharacterized protein LOC131025954 [Salvia miltiorrhiza]|uniref:uncharacterized protein LOC131025954 n=1 Tax=Salvia miltiorrhiza TaxID=226208 RepID=UPI0025AC921E|nr:uncharacterized protein LOC131025954 [Salvia miltiorrhiza]